MVILLVQKVTYLKDKSLVGVLKGQTGSAGNFCCWLAEPEMENLLFVVLQKNFMDKKTKLNLECLKDGHKWVANTTNIVNGGKGCPKCKGANSAEQKKTPEPIALQRCIDVCKEMDYDVVGFPSGYKNCYSCFEYSCKIHGKQRVRYHDFINGGTRCGGCWKDKQKELGNLYGYYPERRDEVDYLYVLDFDGKFIKVGRSFDVN